MRAIGWRKVAVAILLLFLSVLGWFGTSLVGKVEALEEDNARNKTLLEKIYDDVRWMRDNWGSR